VYKLWRNGSNGSGRGRGDKTTAYADGPDAHASTTLLSRYRRPVRRVGIALLLLLGPACAATTPDNAAVERDYAEHRSTVEVTAEGAVTSVLADDSGPSGTHQRFIIRLAGATQTVLVDNNVTIGQRVPVHPADDVVVHGEYIWNDQGGLIHFTHHDPAPAHEGGWIELKGVRYQ
jgi:Protein of unknown function (DUF3465)